MLPWLLPPPGPAVMSLAVLAGLVAVALALARRLRSLPDGLTVSACFIVTVGVLSAAVHALALGGLSSPAGLRVVGGGAIACGLGLLAPANRRWFRSALRGLPETFRQESLVARIALAGSLVTGIALGLAALGPATDIDSLAYHLSVPLDWLEHGGARATPDWLHARLVGIGESMGLLGLALGTDSLSTVLQAAGIVVAVASITSVAATRADRVLGAALVAACPLLPFLSLTSKPQLLPAAATVVAVALVARHRREKLADLDHASIWLVCGCAAYAVACKYSFIPAGMAVMAMLVASVWRTRWLAATLVAGVAAFGALVLPVYARNFAWYGDPLSPLLERFRADADPVIQAFAWYLRNFAGGHSWDQLLRLPSTIVFPTGPRHLTTVLGAGALAALTIGVTHHRHKVIVAAAGAITVVAATLGQLQARFFFEPYLWFALAAVLSPWNVRKRMLLVLISMQMIVTVPVAVYGAARFLPAALATGARERALHDMAADYSLARWLEGVIAADARVATDRHSNLFTPRPAIYGDFVRMLTMTPIAESEKRERILALLQSGGVDTIVVTAPIESSPFGWLVADLGPPAHISPEFRDAVRNPWKEGRPFRVYVYEWRGPVSPIRERLP